MLVVGQESIADVFGVAPKTIVDWQSQGFPVAVRGGPGVPSEYDTRACIAWKIEIELRKVRSESPADRLARVRADAQEMNNFERKRLLLPAEQIEPKLKAAFLSAREQFQDSATRIARQAQGKTVAELEDLLSQAFEALLTRMSRYGDVDELEDEDDE